MNSSGSRLWLPEHVEEAVIVSYGSLFILICGDMHELFKTDSVELFAEILHFDFLFVSLNELDEEIHHNNSLIGVDNKMLSKKVSEV